MPLSLVLVLVRDQFANAGGEVFVLSGKKSNMANCDRPCGDCARIDLRSGRLELRRCGRSLWLSHKVLGRCLVVDH